MKSIFYCFGFILLFVNLLNAQNPLSGYILDEEGQPYIGLKLEIFETGQHVLTDQQGYYFFNIEENAVYALVIKHPYHDIYKAVTVEDTTEYSVVIRREIRFDEIIVRATRASEKDPISYTEVSGEQLSKQSYGQDVPYLLQWEPSIVVTSDAGTGIGYTGMRIRGSDPSRIAVTINGIPLNDAESQGVWWVDLPDFASSTDDVQIQRGVGSSTHGSGSFGGSMNFNTNKLHLDSYAKINGAIGAFGTQKAAISAGTGLIEGRFGIDGRYSKIHTDGYVDRASADLQSLYLSGVYVGEDQSLRFTVMNGHEITYLAWNGLPYQYINVDSLRTFNSAGMEKSGKPYDNEVDNYNQSHYQLFYNKEYNKQWNLSLASFYTHGKGFYEQYKANEKLSDYGVKLDSISPTTDLIRRKWLNNHFYGINYALNYISPNEKSDFTLGGIVSQYLGAHFGEVIGIPFPNDSLFTNQLPQLFYDNEATKNDLNIFTKYTYRPSQHWQFIGDVQYRYVNYQFEGKFEDQEQEVERKEVLNFINPKLGISYINNQHLLYMSVARTGHEPNRSDYTEASEAQVPEAEYLNDIELGYKWSSNKTNFFVNAYYMQYENQLALSGKLSDVGEYVRINIPESYRSGIELGGALVVNQFNINANATISQNKAISFTEYVDNWDTGIQDEIEHNDTDLSFSPSIISGVGLDYAFQLKSLIPQSLVLSYQMKYVGEQFLDNTSSSTAKLEAYNYSNLQLSYNVSFKKLKAATLKLQVNNLFDQKYVSNGWAYRFNTQDNSVLNWDPSSVREHNTTNTYNLIGLYPQAGRHLVLAIDVSF